MANEPLDELTVQRFLTALEHEKFTGPVNVARYAGERAYQIARRRAERTGASDDEAESIGKRAFWVAYFTDLAEEAAVRAKSAREDVRANGDERATPERATND
jgi:hypothetical protein